MNNKQTIVNIILAAIVAVSGYYLYNNTFNSNPSSEEEISGETTSNPVGTSTTTNTEPLYTIEKIPTEKAKISAPSLNRPLTFTGDIPLEAKKIITDNVKRLTDILKSDSSRFDAWLDLGSYRKQSGDYEGAREAWEYATLLLPGSYVPWNNLGDLYQYYLKDFVKAEKNFQQAIVSDPSFVQAYHSLFELYTLSYTEKAHLADDTLLEGLKKSPNNIDLLITLAQYYKGTGKTEEAKKYYKMAITEAEKAGNTALAESLKSELDTL
ncbi:MAG: hypothetical protein NUV49_00780 [Patescibacteria group bacterium]|nr:hypothetical protein [Patescibacteria group bacterium]